MSPRGPSRAPKYRKPTPAKTLKTIGFSRFLGVQGRPRQPLKTQKGFQEAILGYLRPSWAILERSWDQELFRNLRPKNPVARPRHLCPFWSPFWGPTFALFWQFLGSFFGSLFCHFLDHFWANFGAHFGTRSAQEGAKMSPRGKSRASKNQKAAFPKTLKKPSVF